MAMLCCEQMRRQVEHRCEAHRDPHDCPDVVIIYWEKVQEYGLIIRDGGAGAYVISYCPWCGSKLPESTRDEWSDDDEFMA